MIRATICCLVAFAAIAEASPKVALPAIEGDETGAMRDAVVGAIDGEQLTVLGERETNRAVDALRNENLAELTEKQATKLSKDLEAEAIVTVVYTKKGKAKTLKFRLFVNGKKQKGFTVQFKNAKSELFKTKLHDKMVERITSATEPPKPPPVAKEDEEPVKKRIKKGDPAEEEEDPNPKKKIVKQEDDEEDGAKKKKKKKKKTASEDEEEDEDEVSIRKHAEGPVHTANRVAARLDVGASFGNRSLVFTQRGNFPEGPKPFRSAPVPGVRFDAEIYPLAFMNPNSIAAGLGGYVEYDKTLVMNLGTTAEPGKKVKVDRQALTVGGRFRFAFGKRATSPTVTLGFDYGRSKFVAKRGALMDPTSLDLPDTDYKFLAPGAGFRIPIGTFLAFQAYGKGMFVNNAGPIQQANSYGKAKIIGIEAAAGFDIVFSNRFALRLQGELVQIGYSFVGTGGAMVNSRDGNPSTKDIGGATDRSIGGTATLGVLY